jgi:hypothetical protein
VIVGDESRVSDQEDIRQVHAAIDFGFEVEAFLKSRLGSYLIKRAEADIEIAVEKLKTADPDDAKSIRVLQNEIYRAEAIQYWMAEAIQGGINAQRELIEGE